jgi:hypothetical protein
MAPHHVVYNTGHTVESVLQFGAHTFFKCLNIVSVLNQAPHHKVSRGREYVT